MRWRKQSTAIAMVEPPLLSWDEITTMATVLEELERAREIAVRLEQENAAVPAVMYAVRSSLTGAITADEPLAMVDDLSNFNPYRPGGGSA